MCRSFIALLVVLIFVSHASAARIRHQPDPERITFRVLAVADQIPISSFSPNRDSLLVMLTTETQPEELAKIKFSYMGYQYPFSPDLIKSGLWHTFVAMRDRSCDEAWLSFSTKSQTGSHGSPMTTNVLTYVLAESVPDVGARQMLPCYVVREQGYKGSLRSSPNGIKFVTPK